MRFLIDMNLSPDWIGLLQGAGHDAVHWSSVGPADACDDDLVSWARARDTVVLTNDLDFGTILTMSGAINPSVVQLRLESTLPARVGSLVAKAIRRAESELDLGAIVTVEEKRLRVRSLDPSRKAEE